MGRALHVALRHGGEVLFGKGPLAVSPGVGWAVHSVSHSHQQVDGGPCHPEPCSSGCICSCTKPWFGSDILLQDVPRGLLSAFLQEQLLGHVSPCWGLLYFALDTWSTDDKQENEVFFSAAGWGDVS